MEIASSLVDKVADDINKDRRQTKYLLQMKKLASPKSVKPWSVTVKNGLLLFFFLAGLVQMVRKSVISSGSFGSVNLKEIADMEGRIANVESYLKRMTQKFSDMEVRNMDVESYLKRTTQKLQDQVEVVDKKMKGEILSLRSEIDNRFEKNTEEIGSRLNILEEKHQLLEKALGQLNSKDFKIGDSGQIDLSLDEIRALARQIVEQEIEKHAADGLGRVDYALRVLDHSKPFEFYPYRIGYRSDPNKMLRPSFGEPGECYALEGSIGFAVLKLRAAIIPEAVTLEHVAKSVANDRSNAPRDCRVFGWLRGVDDGGKTLLAEFTYDLDKSNAQTYNVLDSANSTVVNTIRFEFTSNHGSPSHTCIYRIRVHGHEPNWSCPVSSALNGPILLLWFSFFSLLCSLCIFF